MSVDIAYMRGLDNKRRPPIVRYHQRARFDQALTNRSGRSMYIDEDVAEITSPDGGVTLTKNVTEWFGEIEKDPQYFGWVSAYKQMYTDWKKANDVTAVDGTHLKNWPLISPAQCEMLLKAGYPTIDAVANMPDETAASFDFGLFVRSKARYWINSAEDIGSVASEVASLRAENETLLATIEDQARKLGELKSENERLTTLVTGRDGFDIVAGRAQPVGLQIVRDIQQAAAPTPVAAPAPTPAAPAGPALLSLDQVKALNMADLRSYCYEHNVKPHTSKDETYGRLVEAKQVA